MKECSYAAFEDSMDVWTQGIIDSPPTTAFRQMAWDNPHVKVAFQPLLIFADSDRARAHIKATAKEESSAWLRAIPLSSLGLR